MIFLFSKIATLVTKTIDPLASLIDNVHTSKEEELEAQRLLQEIENTLTMKLLDLHQEELKAKTKVLVAEAKSEHWLTSSWRPITALVFTFIIANNYIIAPYSQALFGAKVMFEIPHQLWELLKLMIGGYVLSRGVEKSVAKFN